MLKNTFTKFGEHNYEYGNYLVALVLILYNPFVSSLLTVFVSKYRISPTSFDAIACYKRNWNFKPTAMERLPNELVVKIFSYFHPIYENLARHAMVCRKWSEIIESTALLWKHIHLDDNRHNSPNMETEYRKVLCDCLLRFGRFVHCIRAEEETFFTSKLIRDLMW